MTLMVRYRVKADRAAENEALIRDVFAALERERPAGLRYTSLRLDDGRTFVHLAEIETSDRGNPLLALAAFQRFVATIRERCDEPPITTQVSRVGAYRWEDTGALAEVGAGRDTPSGL